MLLEDLSHVRLLVVGDVMLDRYWFGDVSRISPEAPVPVVRVERSEEQQRECARRPSGDHHVAGLDGDAVPRAVVLRDRLP